MEINPLFIEVSLEDPRAFVLRPDGRRQPLARSLGEWIAEFGGYSGTIELPRVGHADRLGSITVSLEPYRGRDLDNTFFVIGWSEQYSLAEAVTLDPEDTPPDGSTY
jgi:hypothetical protein